MQGQNVRQPYFPSVSQAAMVNGDGHSYQTQGIDHQAGQAPPNRGDQYQQQPPMKVMLFLKYVCTY